MIISRKFTILASFNLNLYLFKQEPWFGNIRKLNKHDL